MGYMKKQLCGSLIALCMVLTLFPVSALDAIFGADTGGRQMVQLNSPR